jgi:hypothetical protein
MSKSLALPGTAVSFLVRARMGLIGRTDHRGVYVHDGVEHCKPHGTHSMCAVISADRHAD